MGRVGERGGWERWRTRRGESEMWEERRRTTKGEEKEKGRTNQAMELMRPRDAVHARAVVLALHPRRERVFAGVGDLK